MNPNNLPSKANKIRRDTETLLAITRNLQPFLVVYGESHNRPELDENVRLACESTMIRCCSALETVIERLASTKVEDAFEQAVLSALSAEKDAHRAHAAALKAATRPSIHHPPALTHLDSGQWVAILGDPADVNSCVIGLGDTPAEAMISFDQAFHAKTKPEPAPAPAVEPAPKPRRKKK